MKRKSSGSTAIIVIGILAVGACGAAGYYLTGSHADPTKVHVQPAATVPAPIVETAPNPAPVQPRQVASAGKYTAPGAPAVEISELKSVPVPEKTETDPEASQTGDTSTSNEQPDPSPPAATVPPTTSPDASAQDSSTTSSSTNASPVAPTTIAPSTLTSPVVAPSSTSVSTGTPLYCVEAGTFANEKNAKSLIDNLQKLGFAAAVVPTDGTDSSFRVQVGAFHTRTTAENAVAGLQKQGYPAYVITK